MGFIYLIKLKKDENENVYKVGMTNQFKLLDRLNGYGKLGVDYVVEYFIEIDYTDISEKEILKIFKEHFYLYKGREYFMGNCNEMINIIRPFGEKLKQEQLIEDYKKELNERRTLQLKDLSKNNLMGIIRTHHKWFETINKYSKYEPFKKQDTDYYMCSDEMVWSMSDNSEEIEQLKKQIEERDEKIKQIEEDISLKHSIRYDILRRDLRLCLSDTDKDDDEIFKRMFKWLDKSYDLEKIKKNFSKMVLHYRTRKGAIWVNIKFHHHHELGVHAHDNIYIYSEMSIFNEEYNIGTNEIIFTILKKIIDCNNTLRVSHHIDTTISHYSSENHIDEDFHNVVHFLN